LPVTQTLVTPSLPSAARECRALDVATATRQGGRRSRNEDAVASFADGRIVVLADGMSARPDGHLASAIALREVRAMVADAGLDAQAVVELDGFAAARWINASFHAARRALFAARADILREPVGIETSLLVGVIARRQTIVGHAGHSRAYLWRGQLVQLTADHADEPPLDHAADDGRRGTGVLVSAPLRGLGDVARADVEITTAPIAAGDYLLFCTNGVTDTLPPEAIASQLAGNRTARSVADDLLAAVELADAEDDASAVVVRCDRWEES
jgi:PPM family protein phosphatase